MSSEKESQSHIIIVQVGFGLPFCGWGLGLDATTCGHYRPAGPTHLGLPLVGSTWSCKLGYYHVV